MIKSWKHKGLKDFFTSGDITGVKVDHVKRLKIILQRLNAAVKPEDMDTPGMKFHKLKGNFKNFYSVTVNKNWRIIFKFNDQNAILVNYCDYH